MRVALDVTAESRGGHDRGIGRYLAAVREANTRLGNDVIEISYRMGSGRLSEVLGSATRELALARNRSDLVHAPTAYYAPVLPRRAATVVSILDVIPLDLREHRQTGLKARFVHRAAARAGAVLTLSQHSADRIVELLGVARDRVVVAPLPPAAAFTPAAGSVEVAAKPYAAAMADLRTPDSRKRIEWLPEIARGLRSENIDLVIVGPGTEALSGAGLVGHGTLSDDSWADVLRSATALVYTSAYEGQGMPPLEAIACGTPVIAMDNTAIPEVVGPAGVLVPEGAGGPGRLADEVIRLVTDPVALAILRDRCAAQSADFSIERFADGIASAYRRAGERSG